MRRLASDRPPEHAQRDPRAVGRSPRSVTPESNTPPEAAGLTVNGQPREVDLPCSVQELLRTLSIGDRRVAVAINRNVIPRSTFASHQLTAGDRVEIIEAVGGG